MNYEIRTLSAQFRRSPILAWCAFLFSAGAVLKIADYIVQDDTVALLYVALIFAGSAVVVAILKNWRNGLYFFLAWLFFEDLARKYLGNNMAIFFGKDILVAVVYLSFFIAYRKLETESFRPPFIVPLAIFFWFGLAQIFNPGSPHFAYGLLGMKLYFYYMPLMFVGYSLVECEEDVRRLFRFLVSIAVIIVGLGIIQAVVGRSFLNPTVLQEDIRELSENYRVAPISGAVLYRPNSVFVSNGRFSFYLLPACLLACGFAGYLFLRVRSRAAAALAIISLGVCILGVVMAGSRGPVMWTLGSAIVCAVAFIWGAPWRKGQVMRVVRSLSLALVVGFATLALMIAFYPGAVGSRIEFYSATLLGSNSQLAFRAQEYPLRNFLVTLDSPHWDVGYGIGTMSLGTQYVTHILKIPRAVGGTESGYGTIVLEMGVGGLFLWILMTAAVVVAAVKTTFKLRGTAWFPIGFVIMWFAFVLLFPETFSGLAPYHDYVLNAQLWLLLGVLFRLPHIPLSLRFNLSTDNAPLAGVR